MRFVTQSKGSGLLGRLAAAIFLFGVLAVWAPAQNAVIGFDDDGWNSDDTRIGDSGTAGTNIINSTTNDPASGTTSNPTQVATQLDWENYLFSRGNLGALSMSPDGDAAGKATISKIDITSPNGFGTVSSTLTPSFSAEWRWSQEGTVNEGASFKMGIQSEDWGTGAGQSQEGFSATRSGEGTWDLVIVAGAGGTGIEMDSADYATRNFDVFAQAGNTYFSNTGGGRVIDNSTLEDILTGNANLTQSALDAGWTAVTLGDVIKNGIITNTQVGVGSGTADGLPALDWLSVSYLNGGDKIDFIDAARYSGTNSDYGNSANWEDADGNPVAASGTQNYVVEQDATLNVASSTTGRSLGILSGTTNLTINEDQTLTLSEAENGTFFVEYGATANVQSGTVTTGTEGILNASVLESAGTLNLSTIANLNGGANPHPQRDGSGDSRYAIVVHAGGEMTLASGADVTIDGGANDTNVGVRVGGDGDPADGVATLNIENGSTLTIDSTPGGSSSNGFFTIGAWGQEGVVNQTGGTVNLTQTTGHAGSFNVGNQGGTGSYNLSGGTLNLGGGNHSLGRVRSTSVSAGSGTMNISGTGTLNLNDDGFFVVGDRDGLAAQGDGIIDQTGGTFSVANTADLYLGGFGSSTYNLEGGTLEIGGNSLKGNFGSATTPYDFNLQGGTIQVTGSDLDTSVDINVVDIDMNPATATTSYIDTNSLNATLSGGISGDGILAKVGVGKLNLTGSSRSLGAISTDAGEIDHQSGITTTAFLFVGAYPSLSANSDGTFTLTDGTIDLTTNGGAVFVGSGSSGANTGQLNIDGGTLNLGVAADPSVRVDFYVGAFGSGGAGTVTQTGGTVNKLSDLGILHIGNQSSTGGIYNLEGGNLNIEGTEGMALGRSSASTAGEGTLNVSGGTLSIDGSYLFLGGAQGSEPETGSGTVNQTGGLVSLINGAGLTIGRRGSGEYNLNDGVIEVSGSINKSRTAAGGSNLNLGGGTLRAIENDLNISSDVVTTLTTATNSTFDTNGQNIVASGGLAGTGSFTKVNSGNLELGGTTTLSGTSTNAGDDNIIIGSAAAGAGTLNLNAGAALNVDDSTGSGFSRIIVGNAETGTMNINGGTIDLRYYAGNGATFRVGGSGGNGTVNMTDGSVTVTQGSAGLYAVIDVGSSAGSEGEFNQSGGSITMNGVGNLHVGTFGGTGTFSMSGDATFTMNGDGSSGGTFFIGNGAGSDATVNFSNNATFVQNDDVQTFIADGGATAVFNQDGAGTNVTWEGDTGTNDRPFWIGNSGTGGVGTYNLHAGNLNFSDMEVSFGRGTGNTGILNQTGGNLTADGDNGDKSAFVIGGSGTGEYHMDGGAATFNEGLTVAASSGSMGTVNQTGGTVTIGNGEDLRFGSGAGTYNLGGGTLEVGGTNGISAAGSGTPSFNYGGGTLRVVNADLSSSVDMAFDASTTSTIDTNGLNATLSGVLSGSGNATKTGAGTLNLTEANTQTGTLTVSDGTVDLASAASFAGDVAVDMDGALSGEGTIEGAAVIHGTHAPGNSPGTQTFSSDLSYGSTATLQWDLNANTNSGAGTNFDLIVVNGNLVIDPGATIELVFNGVGSTVDFTDSFWSSDQIWTIADVAGTTSGLFSNIDFSGVDSQMHTLGVERPNASFAVALSGNDLNLEYYAVPEPGTGLLLLVGGAFLFSVRRRRER